MAISLQADSTLPQGYILVDGQRVASVSTTGGLSATLAANTVTTSSLVSGSVTLDKISQNSGPFSFRNKIINGDMRIDQRRNGALDTSSNNVYGADRFVFFSSVTPSFSVQRLSADGPGPITTCIRSTIINTRTPASGDIYGVVQRIETQNLYDLQYGTPNARPITLSFWVKSSVTGTYGARIGYTPPTLSPTSTTYVYTYTINQANTWEYKTVTIPGNTAFSSPSNPVDIGLDVLWNLGTGSSRSTNTPNQWLTADNHTANGTVSFVSQSPGATWQITGVQLEVGSVATPFEQRPIGLELSLCQRYYWQPNGGIGVSAASQANIVNFAISFPDRMRIAPQVVGANDPPRVSTTETHVGMAAQPANGYNVSATAFNAEL